MSKVKAVLDQIEAEQRQAARAIPDNIPLLELADMVVRGKVKLSASQMRMLIEMLPYVAPKLSAMALSTMTNEDFAARLDRCIERSGKVQKPKQLLLQDLRGQG